MKWELVTEEQKQYIKDNFWKMEQKEMANNLGIGFYDVNYICQILKLSRLWKYDDEKLIKLCDGTRSYLDIQKEMPHRTRNSIERRCQQLKINQLIKRENSDFTVQELESFKLDYPKYSNKELSEIYNKTENQISGLARTLNLYKIEEVLFNSKINNSIKATVKAVSFKNENEYLCFTNDIKKIQEVTHNNICELKQKYKNINFKYIKAKIEETHNCKIFNKNKKYIVIYYCDSELETAFKFYKNVLNGVKIQMGKYIKIKKQETVKLLFKYYFKRKNIEVDKKFFINNGKEQILNDTKLRFYIENLFVDYYDFLKFCYPTYNFIKDDFKIIDGQKFDSFEEADVYNCFKQYKDIKIKKNYKKYFNEEETEFYIPDFILLYKDIKIICEYYGLYKEYDNYKKSKEYREKTKRKNKFFKKNYKYFLPIYPPKNRHRFEEGIIKQIEEYFNKIMFN